jgi:hypothetical protein
MLSFWTIKMAFPDTRLVLAYINVQGTPTFIRSTLCVVVSLVHTSLGSSYAHSTCPPLSSSKTRTAL